MGQRIVCTVPPKGYFGRRDHDDSRVCIEALRDLGHHVYELDVERFEPQNIHRIDETLNELIGFGADFAISLNNAGYAFNCDVAAGETVKNIFTDILGIPVVLPWDDPLGQFANQILKPLPDTPNQSSPGCLNKLAKTLGNPLNRHQSWDTGHIESMIKLGLVRRDMVRYSPLKAVPQYLDFGIKNKVPSSYDRNICFVGNVYPNAMEKSPLHRIPIVRDIAKIISKKKSNKFTLNIWDLFIGQIQAMPANLRDQLKLYPDQSFFWSAYTYITWMAANTYLRLSVITSSPEKVHFFGGFADPEGIPIIQSNQQIIFEGTVDYLTELPAVFNRSKITLDITNQLAQNSAPGKLYECFAAGGFMLIDYSPDIIDCFGEIAKEFSYRNLEELKEKIDYFISHDKQRKEIIRYMQDEILEQHTLYHWLAGIVENVNAFRFENDKSSTINRYVINHRRRHKKETFAADALWNQQSAIIENIATLKELHKANRLYISAGDSPQIPWNQMLLLLAMTLEFKPDLILELGRGFTNTTLALNFACNILGRGNCQLHSICSGQYQEIEKSLSQHLPGEWFDSLKIYQDGILRTNYYQILKEKKRVLVSWSESGYDVAECVLGGILPILESKDHVVIMHDIKDARYEAMASEYNGNHIWKGGMDRPGPMIRLENILASVPQAVSIYDFISRNSLDLFSATHSLYNFYKNNRQSAKQMMNNLGLDLLQTAAIHWLTLNQKHGPFTYPRFIPNIPKRT